MSSLLSFDDVLASIIESSILEFTEEMTQIYQEQQIMTLPSGIITAEAPLLVSTVITTTTPPLVSTTVATTSSSQVLNVTDTTTLVLVSQTTTTTSQTKIQVFVTVETGTTNPTTKSKFLQWLDSVVPKRKKQVISPDDFDFDQLGLVKEKVTKKPNTMSRILVDPVRKRKYAEVLMPSSNKDKDNIQSIDYTMQTMELGVETHESVK